MKQVKGSMFKLVIKAIKANKTDIYHDLLSENSKELLSKRIIDSVWYPFDAYKNCFNALCEVQAKNDQKVLKEWGRVESERLMTTTYKVAITQRNLISAMDKYRRFHKRVFNFGDILSVFDSNSQMIVTYEDFEQDFENFYHIAIGWIDKFIDLCIGKKANYTFLKKSWEGADATQFKASW